MKLAELRKLAKEAGVYELLVQGMEVRSLPTNHEERKAYLDAGYQGPLGNIVSSDTEKFPPIDNSRHNHRFDADDKCIICGLSIEKVSKTLGRGKVNLEYVAKRMI